MKNSHKRSKSKKLLLPLLLLEQKLILLRTKNLKKRLEPSKREQPEKISS